MDHIKVLKRAWEILKHYRVLWIFGILLALTTASAGGGQSNYRTSSDESPPEWNYQIPEGSEIQGEIEAFVRSLVEGLQPRVGLFIFIGIAILLIGLTLFIISRIVRYVSETSLIRMVDDYEETGERYTFRQGWKLGWSRAAWRLFLINLVIDLPIAVVFLCFILLAFSPLLLWGVGNLFAGVIGVVSTIGFAFLIIFFGVIVATVVTLLKRFFFRVCVLEEAGVRAAIREGFAFVKENWKDVGLMWLITVGINIGWPILMIPVVLILFAIGALLGGGVGLLVRGLAGLVLGNGAAWIVAGVVGLPIFVLVLSVPLVFLGGLKQVFLSSTWTLTYRELRALERLESQPVLESPAEPGLA